MLADFLASYELQYTVDNIETCDINLSENVFCYDVQRTCERLKKIQEFEAAHPCGSLQERVTNRPMEGMLTHLANTYTEWTLTQAN